MCAMGHGLFQVDENAHIFHLDWVKLVDLLFAKASLALSWSSVIAEGSDETLL